MAYSLPEDVHERPVTIDGAGTLGRRIATVFAAGGSDVRVFDASAEQARPAASTSRSTSPRSSGRSICGRTGRAASRSPRAAIKRECLMVVEEGVAGPEDIDEMWRIFTRPGIPPFRLMDRVGLDVVLAIEEHYADVRDGIPEGPRTLLRRYVDEGRLGTKSGGGFYDEAS